MWKSKFYGAFVLNHRVVLHAIDATPARWRGDAGSSPLDRAGSAASSPRNDSVKNCRVHPTHWLISTQVPTLKVARHPVHKGFMMESCWALYTAFPMPAPGQGLDDDDVSVSVEDQVDEVDEWNRRARTVFAP